MSEQKRRKRTRRRYIYYYSSMGQPFCAPRKGDCGWDIRAAEPVVLLPGKQEIISTGLFLALPDDHVGLIKERSSYALLKCYTHAGVIDPSYRGEIRIVMANHGHAPVSIEAGHRIAQIVVIPCFTGSGRAKRVHSELMLGRTVRLALGFGSTGS